MRFFNTIKFRFTLWYLIILSTILIVFGIGIYLSLSKKLHQNLDDSLIVRAEQIANFRDVIAIIAGGTFEDEPGELLSFYYFFNGRLMDVSPKGLKIPVDTTWVKHIIDGGKGFLNISTVKEGDLRLYSMPYTPENKNIRLDKFTTRQRQGPPPKRGEEWRGSDSNRPKPGWHSAPPPPPQWNDDRRKKSQGQFELLEIDKAALIVARSTKDIDVALARLLQILLMALPTTLILAGGSGIFLLRIILKPVEEITGIAREIEENDLSKRIAVNTKDEMGRLACTLNLMIERLEKAFVRQKELTGDASHELRAPLAVIQAEATLALQKNRDLLSYKKSLEIIAQESDHISGIIKQLLLLARADSGKEQVTLQRFNLTSFLTELCDDVDVLCREKNQTLQMELSDQVYIKGDKNLLRNLTLNLIMNAVQYTGKGGSITVSLVQEKTIAIVSVSDTGIGIPAKALPHIFNRFYRVDKDRSRMSGGSGLGLAICKHIVELHKGKLQVKSQIDHGSSFIVRFPLASPRSE